MKVGDRLYCHSSIEGQYIDYSFDIGKYYKVELISESEDFIPIELTTNGGGFSTFTFECDENGLSYRNWL